jgi:1-acyl-sn-glycerol-3-phosphate acyltransferase
MLFEIYLDVVIFLLFFYIKYYMPSSIANKTLYIYFTGLIGIHFVVFFSVKKTTILLYKIPVNFSQNSIL